MDYTNNVQIKLELTKIVLSCTPIISSAFRNELGVEIQSSSYSKITIGEVENTMWVTVNYNINGVKLDRNVSIEGDLFFAIGLKQFGIRIVRVNGSYIGEEGQAYTKFFGLNDLYDEFIEGMKNIRAIFKSEDIDPTVN